METVQFNDGNQIPAVGFGVFRIPADGSTYQAVKEALAVTRLPQRKEPAKSTFDGLIFIHLSHFRLTCHFRSSYDNNKQAWPFITL